MIEQNKKYIERLVKEIREKDKILKDLRKDQGHL